MFQNNAIFYLKNQKNPQKNPVFYQKNCAVLKGHSSAVLCQKYTKFIHTQQKSNQHSHSFLRGYVASADIRCVHRMKDSLYEILLIKYRRYVAFIGSRALCKLGVGLFANIRCRALCKKLSKTNRHSRQKKPIFKQQSHFLGRGYVDCANTGYRTVCK